MSVSSDELKTINLDPSSEKIIAIDEEDYTIKLISFSGSGATINVTDEESNTEEKSIDESESSEFLDINILLNEISESQVELIISESSLEKFFLEADHNQGQESLKIENETYDIQLISAKDDSASIKLTNSKEESEIKEIKEGSFNSFLGIIVSLINSDVSDSFDKETVLLKVGFDPSKEIKTEEINETPINQTNITNNTIEPTEIKQNIFTKFINWLKSFFN